ncbi:MAG: hypothetical protein MJ233_00130 [Mycoplasmoidaceae bacterium]|nr:hypothetical protein [Mycoplasmoidaceae bacterium]
MPSNSRNIAAESFNKIVNEAGKRVHEANQVFEQYLYENYGLSPEQSTGRYYETSRHELDSAMNAAQAAVGKWCYPHEYNAGLLTDR